MSKYVVGARVMVSDVFGYDHYYGLKGFISSVDGCMVIISLDTAINGDYYLCLSKREVEVL